MAQKPPSPGLRGAERRRSQRLLLSVAVLIRGKEGDRIRFEEETHTLIVNAHGGLVALGTPVQKGETILVRNKMTQQEEECIIVFLGPTHAAKTQVGFEFKKPSGEFWRVSFPPDDWQPSD